MISSQPQESWPAVGSLEACGELLVRTYMNQAAPSVEPAAVELHVTGEIGGVSVQG